MQHHEKDTLDGTIVLIELMREEDSFAVFALEEQGVKRVDVTTWISHGKGRKKANGGSATSRKRDE